MERQLYLASRAGTCRSDFESGFLRRLLDFYAADGVAIWHDPGGDALYLYQHLGFPISEIREDVDGWRRHGRLLRLAATGTVRSFAPRWTDGHAENPTGAVLSIAPAALGSGPRAIVELVRQPGGITLEDESAYLLLLQRAAEFAADYLACQFLADQVRAAAGDERRWEFVKRVHQSLDPIETAFVIAHAGTILTGCDRVCVLLRRRNRAVTAAVSGQAAVNRRANLVRLLEALGTRVLRVREPVTSGFGANEQCAESVRGALQTYRHASGGAALLAVPLRDLDPKRPPLGVIVMEQNKAGPPPSRFQDDVEFLVEHASAALRNALKHDRIVLRSWRTAAGTALRETTRARFWAAACILTVTAAVLCLIPWPLRLEARGTLRAADRRGIFAPEEGIVQQVLATHNRHVAAGEPLAVLENNDLRARYQQVLEELAAVQQQRAVLEAERSGRAVASQRQLLLDGEITELAEREKSLTRQERLLSQRLDSLSLRAPIDGWIATWEPERVLAARPVQQGHLLLQLIAEDSRWELQLELDDADSGYVLAAWAQRDGDSLSIPVDYVLATHPGHTFRGWMTDIAPRTQSLGGRHLVSITAVPDENDVPPLRDGATVRAKIRCGERPLGFVMFRELIEFVQSHVLF